MIESRDEVRSSRYDRNPGAAFEIDNDFHCLALGAGGKIQQRVLVELS